MFASFCTLSLNKGRILTKGRSTVQGAPSNVSKDSKFHNLDTKRNRSGDLINSG
jgi:hypothetical protein